MTSPCSLPILLPIRLAYIGLRSLLMTSKMQALLLFFPLVLEGQPAAHDILPMEGSRFTLDVYKTKIWEGRKHTFVFDRFNGAVSYDREHAERSTVAFTVESGSARCIDDWVKPSQIKDIENAALSTMAAVTFPQMTFQSTAIVPKSSDQYEVRGLLTIRSQTKPVTLIARLTPREGGIWVEGSGRISLADFGLKPPRGIVGVSLFIGTKDEMTVQFSLFAKRVLYAE